MKKRRIQQVSMKFFALFLLFNVAVLSASQPDYHPAFEIQTDRDYPVIVFTLPEGWKTKLLNRSPAIKILVKISKPHEGEEKEWVDHGSLAAEKGFRQYRIIPIDSDNYLFVFELAEKTPFAWLEGPGNKIVVRRRLTTDPAEIAYRKGLKYHESGKLRRALSFYRRAVHLNRQHGNAYYKAGQIRFAFHQYRSAEIDFKHALRLKSDSLKLYLAVARLYENYNRPDLAKKYENIYREKHQQELQPLAAEDSAEQSDSPPIGKAVEPTQPEKRETDSHTKQAVPDTAIYEVAQLPGGIPLKIIVYLVGIGLLSVFLLVSAMLYFMKRRQRRKNVPVASRSVYQDWQKHRDKILDTARQSAPKREKEQIANTGSDESVSIKKKGTADKNANSRADVGSNPPKQVPASELREYHDSEEADSPRKKLDLARELNLGVGEIELALNLTAQQRRAQKSSSVEAEIEKMFNLNFSTAEIARRMKMGQEEVKLILTMRAREAEKELQAFN